MIGKSLSERYSLPLLDGERAVATLKTLLASHAKPIVEVRAAGERMIACVVTGAGEAGVRLCRRFGLELSPGGVGVFGILGEDASRLFPGIQSAAWLSAPSGPRETKVLLVADGALATLSVEADGGKVTITAR